VLRQLIQEHTRLLSHATTYGTAMQAFDLRGMDDAGREQEASRLRITMLEQRRRAIVQQIGKAMGISGELTIARVAGMNPEHEMILLELRKQLKEVVEQVAAEAGFGSAAVLREHFGTVVGTSPCRTGVRFRELPARRNLTSDLYEYNGSRAMLTFDPSFSPAAFANAAADIFSPPSTRTLSTSRRPPCTAICTL